MALLLALALTILAILSVVALSLSWLTRRDVQKLLDVVRKAHDGNGYSDPSAAAVVTAPASPRPAPKPVETPATVPELARLRVALRPDPNPKHGGHELRVGAGAAPAIGDVLDAPPAIPRRVVSVTRDDDPAHTRPTLEVPPPTSSDHDASDRDAMRLDFDAWQEAEEQRERDRAERAALRAKWEAAEDERERARQPAAVLPRLAPTPEASPGPDDEDSLDEVTRVLSAQPGEATAQIPGVPLSSTRRAPSTASSPLPFEDLVGTEDATPRPAGTFPAFKADDEAPVTPTKPSGRDQP